MQKSIWAGTLILLCGYWCSAQQNETLSPFVRRFVKIESPIVALTHVRLIDGTGNPERENQTIVVSADKIQGIGDSGAAVVPNGAKVLDLAGYTVIPGLVGMHDHMFYMISEDTFLDMVVSFPRLYLAAGVTTIRTAGAIEPYTDLEIKRRIDAGELPGPHIHVTGPYLGASNLQSHHLSGPDDAVNNVNFWLDEGADNLKAYRFITPAELRAVILAAHKRGAKVTGHLCSVGFREAAALGIDNVEHGLVADSEFFPWKKTGECPDNPRSTSYMSTLDVRSGRVHDMIVDLVQRHVAVTSTLPIFEMFVPGRPAIQQRVLDALAPDAKTLLLANKVLTSDSTAIRKYYEADQSPEPAAFKKEMEFEYIFAKAGGLLLAGEDPSWTGVLAGFGDQREVELLAEAGFTPVEAIHIATANGAQFLGEAEHIGTLAPGKQADLVVIHGNPSININDIERVELVFKDGVGYDTAKLIESVRGMVGLR